jgi:tungstate transport system substrate-binding protein
MMKMLSLIPGCLLLALPSEAGAPAKPPVKVAVIGGMTLGGLWQAVTEKFTQDTGWPVELISTGPKPVLAESLKAGAVDLVTLHASDEATDMVANGFATNSQPWARNEHCIVGPTSDPAGIRGMTEGALALKKIAETKSPFIDFMGPGSREVSHRLWSSAGVKPQGSWVLKDESPTPQSIVEFAATLKAYVIVGRIPLLKGKIPIAGMEVLVSGDSNMRRPYVVMIASAKMFPNSNQAGAKALHSWMVGQPGQTFLSNFSQKELDAGQLFFPARNEGPSSK